MKPVSVDGFLVPRCPHCDVDAELRVSPWGRYWQCPVEGCDARVGVHQDSKRAAPLGTLARRPLRELRSACHELFDPLWRGPGARFPHRSAAYAWLTERMGLPPGRAHFGEFDEARCLQAVDVLFDAFLEEFPPRGT